MAKRKNCRSCYGVGGFWLNIDDHTSGIHIHEWVVCSLCGGR